MKKVIAMVLAIVMMMSFACTAFAAETDTEAIVEYAVLGVLI